MIAEKIPPAGAVGGKISDDLSPYNDTPPLRRSGAVQPTPKVIASWQPRSTIQNVRSEQRLCFGLTTHSTKDEQSSHTCYSKTEQRKVAEGWHLMLFILMGKARSLPRESNHIPGIIMPLRVRERL